MQFNNSTNLNLLSKGLDGLWLRQQVTMENIANYSTPGYKSKYVDFENFLKSHMENRYDKTISEINNQIKSSKIVVDENDNLSLRLDGNNVDVEKENLQLAKTQFQYIYTVSEINSYFSKLKSVISEGKK
ncbi:flagellar basal body rod protein FlgB [Sedimentibacter hydroxybenzoicus DSM 7310]|uniref:Flagellar basal body rod protein FlgB n=1 Tax=Sedimentibacter hydroxybenzoicus DSM 7310 TaxID=1123245 RepID=A0A974BGT8_SEDHY|nr:flagellar basal body rod protein FlgB [Sedimentibacter hydroxybenzoicus]NYB72587.1 flagellar basal body rod protein FlgB [Sedimentibacter hydroxybenzoicus DSM 7310]